MNEVLKAMSKALEFEKRIREIYVEAMETTGIARARHIYSLLAEEEDAHVKYLVHNMEKLTREGRFSEEVPELSNLDAEKVAAGVCAMEGALSPEAVTEEIEVLRRALEAEQQTCTFYEKLVMELPVAAQSFFARFLEIEQGHVALLEAEISAALGDGYWFDQREFDLEQS